MKSTNKKMLKSKDIDVELFEYIQPLGGITFKEPDYINTGDGYVKVIHVCQLPKSISDFWLDKIFNIDGTVVTMDIHTKDVNEVKKNIKKSLKEEKSRGKTTRDELEGDDAFMRAEELKNIYHELTRFGEIIKMVDFRIYVMGRNLVELEERCETILKSLEGDSYLSTTFLNETKREWQSMFESYKTQHSKPFSFKPHPLTTEALAIGNPFKYSELIDPYGTLLGFSDVEGAVIFDEFTNTKTRNHYNTLCCGNMGSGKSTFLKKRFKANAAKGNFLRVFDVTGEFTNLTKEFGGKVLKCNGESGILNPLEILRAGEDEYSSYARHITKVSAFFMCIMPTMTDKEIINIQNYLREFYQRLDLTPDGNRVITGRRAADYPKLSEFKAFLEMELEKKKAIETDNAIQEELVKAEALELNSLLKIVKNLVSNYGQMFDGHTSVDNIIDEKIVTFDISEIKDLGNVFVAQMFNMVSLCWDNAINNGVVMKEMWEKGAIDIRDVTRFLILIDESHRWVNTKMPMLLDLLIKYLREARKYFAGITFASQSVRDFMPEGIQNQNVDLIKTLFELTQYKFMFNQDASATKIVGEVFNNALTQTQIDIIPTLEKGDTILSIAGDRSIKFKVWLSKEYEETLFAGGM